MPPQAKKPPPPRVLNDSGFCRHGSLRDHIHRSSFCQAGVNLDRAGITLVGEDGSADGRGRKINILARSDELEDSAVRWNREAQQDRIAGNEVATLDCQFAADIAIGRVAESEGLTGGLDALRGLNV